jgi:tetratricopeptide (TPR) repeat protein
MDGLPGYDNIAPDLARARLAAQRALAIDPTQADAYSVLGFVLMLEGRLAEAEQQQSKALALNPNSATAHFWSGAVQSRYGRVDLEIQENEQARQLDPLLFMNLFIYGQTLAGVRR